MRGFNCDSRISQVDLAANAEVVFSSLRKGEVGMGGSRLVNAVVNWTIGKQRAPR